MGIFLLKDIIVFTRSKCPCCLKPLWCCCACSFDVCLALAALSGNTTTLSSCLNPFHVPQDDDQYMWYEKMEEKAPEQAQMNP